MSGHEGKRGLQFIGAFKATYIILICSLFTPWFDLGADTTPIRGINIVMEHYLGIPLFILLLLIWIYQDKQSIRLALSGEVAFAAMFGLYVYSFLCFKSYWPTIFAPNDGIDLSYSISCTTVWFWIAIGVLLVNCILYQVYLFQKNREGKK